MLGIGTLLPWSSSVVTLPWIAAAARHPPVPPPEVSDALLGVITLAFSLTNTATVFTIAKAGLAARLPPAAQVPAPLIACVFASIAAALAAHADAGGSPLGGRTVVSFALPAAVVQGALTALLNCGGAAMAAPMPPRVMRAYFAGQALAGLGASTGAFVAAAVVAPGQSKRPAENDAEALAALARHASWAFAATSALLTLCLGAYFTLRRMDAAARHPPPLLQRRGGDTFADAAAAPLLDDADRAEQANAPVEPAEAETAPLVPHVADADADDCDVEDDDVAELRLYKLCVFVIYIVSLCVYPDITAWLRPAAARGDGGATAAAAPFGVRMRGDLLVPFSFVVFNAGDLAGRLVAAALPQLKAKQLLPLLVARGVIPLLLLTCNIAPPEGRWAAPPLLARSDTAPLLLLATLAMSNGAATTLAMTGGPACAAPARRGAAATTLTACLVAGISAGSALSVLLSLLMQR